MHLWRRCFELRADFPGAFSDALFEMMRDRRPHCIISQQSQKLIVNLVIAQDYVSFSWHCISQERSFLGLCPIHKFHGYRLLSCRERVNKRHEAEIRQRLRNFYKTKAGCILQNNCKGFLINLEIKVRKHPTHAAQDLNTHFLASQLLNLGYCC